MEVVGLVVAQIDDMLDPRARANASSLGATSAALREVRSALLLVGAGENETARLAAFDRALGLLGELADPAAASLRSVLERERSNLVSVLASPRRAPTAVTTRASVGLPEEFPPLAIERSRASIATSPEITQRDELLRDALDEVGSLGLLRRTSPDEPWSQSTDFERRLLGALDFLMSLRIQRRPEEPTLALARALADYANDWPIAHPARYFAWAFVLASLAGDAARAELRSVMLRANEDTADSLIDALALGCGESARAVVEDLLDDDARPWSLRIGLAAARRRREITSDSAVALLAHPSRAVAVEAARACANFPLRDVEASLVRALDRGGEIATAAARGLAGIGSPLATKWLRTRVERREAAPEDLMTLALISTQADEPLLLGAAAAGDDPRYTSAALEALSWAGFASAIPLLHAKLVGANSAEERARWARGLSRITGVGCERGNSDAIAIDEPETWRPLLEAFDPPRHVRLRMGKPLERATILEALISDDTLSGHRELLVFELARWDRAPSSIDVDDWIFRQSARLSELAHADHAHHHHAGGR